MGYIKQILGALLVLPSGLFLLNSVLCFAMSSPNCDKGMELVTGFFALIFFAIGVYLLRSGRKLI